MVQSRVEERESERERKDEGRADWERILSLSFGLIKQVDLIGAFNFERVSPFSIVNDKRIKSASY
jgi:hypothetical protein